MRFRPPDPMGRGVLLALILIAAGCEERYVETGDLPALEARGRLRVLLPRTADTDLLPRRGHPLDWDRERAADLARALGLTPAFVWVDRHDDLLPALLAGRGDLVAATLTVTVARESLVTFSRPIGHVREQLVTRVDDTTLHAAADLAGRTVVARRSSAFWQTLQALADSVPGVRIESAPEGLTTEELLYRVATGDYDVTVADDILVDQVLAYTPELRVAFTLGGPRPIAWAVRPDTPQLARAVNRHLDSVRLSLRHPERYTGDLPDLRQRGVLRILTRNSAATYFIWRGQIVGFDYDLARKFTQELGLRLEIVVAPTRAALETWLVQGRGDLIAAGLTPTAERTTRRLAFSRPYHWVSQVVVARTEDTARLRTPRDLAGRTLHVRRSSSYWETLSQLRAAGIAFRLEAVPENVETETIIHGVADGTYDLTVADDHILALVAITRDVAGAVPLRDSVAHAWAVRTDAPALLDAVNAFFDREYRGRFYNITRRKYFTRPEQLRERLADRTRETGRLSPFDSLLRVYGDRFDFDWHLLAAQMYVESRFEPDARSFAGAVGLMQVLPRTAEQLGIDSLTVPEHSIHAGVRFLDVMRGQVDGAATPEDRLWFALAAYNAGFGHLSDARRLARRLGRRDDVWFGEVERVMPLLARAEYHRRARYGYCRCHEPVRYVRRIRNTWRAYADVMGAAEAP